MHRLHRQVLIRPVGMRAAALPGDFAAQYGHGLFACRYECIAPWEAQMPKTQTIQQLFATDGLTPAVIARFQHLVQDHFKRHGRDLPWRTVSSPYPVLVSEVMLQQTQVDRVIPKFAAFIARFPDVACLATAPLPDLLAAWQGLGYNRRALALQQAAQQILTHHDGRVPRDPAQLTALPGIGPYTAGAIAAFAFDLPTVFIETNIRAVMLHYFFPGREQVPDRELLPLVAATLDQAHPRDWYNALMDLGVTLKKAHGNPARRSAHHGRQSPFKGSDRQLRGQLLKLLLAEGTISSTALAKRYPDDQERLPRIIARLIQEGFITQKGRQLQIAN
jgi:A/G-specific adenine glycosylase